LLAGWVLMKREVFGSFRGLWKGTPLLTSDPGPISSEASLPLLVP
jgi:hypothetical protein